MSKKESVPPFWSLDIRACCKIWNEVWLREDELFDVIDDFRESVGSESYEKIDPVYCVLDHILQMARNRIDEVTGYDFINDYSWSGSEIYTYWNYMASSFDYSEWSIEALQEKIAWYIDELKEDEFCYYFLRKIEAI